MFAILSSTSEWSGAGLPMYSTEGDAQRMAVLFRFPLTVYPRPLLHT